MRLTAEGLRMFRNNTAMGWAGKAIRINSPRSVLLYPGDIIVRQGYPLSAGLTDGSSDLIGINPSGKFIACEVKRPGEKMTKEQANFLKFVNDWHGIGFIATSPEDSVNKYKDFL